MQKILNLWRERMKMTKNDDSWNCDTCGRLIRSEDPGWVEWIVYEDETGKVQGRDLRLVHHNASAKHGTHGCQFDQRKATCQRF